MVTVVPQRKRPFSAPLRKPTVPIKTDTTVTKPIRHLAVLPSSQKRSTSGFAKHGTNLSETFTMYEGPTTTPAIGRSLNDTVTMNHQYPMSDLNYQLPMNTELNNDDTYLCNDTTVSSVCELLDQATLKQKPHSLIGRYQLPSTETPTTSTTKPIPAVHIATVHYGEMQPTETANKQVLVQQFYNQLEKFKATFNTETSEPLHQLTTNTLTFDNGLVRQTFATNHLKEKPPIARISSATVKQIDKKPVVPQKLKVTKNPSTRIRSAPITMTTRTKTEIKRNSVSSCKQHRNEKLPTSQKKSIHTKDKQIRRVGSAPPNRIDIHGPEVTLLPQDEEECRQIHDKLQRLQPNGVCVDLNTLRRALYPPIGTTTFSATLNHDRTSAFKSLRQEQSSFEYHFDTVTTLKQNMVRLITFSIIFFIFLVSVHINESRPTRIPSTILSRIWSKDTGFPLEYMDQSDSSTDDVQQLADNDRRKRSCLTFGRNNEHRAAKWMCW
ncbi:hypothetical protein I4U23_019414 [Adineta vaga]|nr:hypothetical protein I4U23_019414 [Adineta vaga]